MRRIIFIASVILLGLFVLLGIQNRAEAPSVQPSIDAVSVQAWTQGDHLMSDSIERSDVTLSIGKTVISAKLAATEEERILGLGGRGAIAKDAGMLFIFPQSDFHGIWMKDMQFPLDIIWLANTQTDTDCAGNYAVENRCLAVIDIRENVMPESYPESFYPKEKASYVLEIKGGAATRNGITIGSVLTLKK